MSHKTPALLADTYNHIFFFVILYNHYLGDIKTANLFKIISFTQDFLVNVTVTFYCSIVCNFSVTSSPVGARWLSPSALLPQALPGTGFRSLLVLCSFETWCYFPARVCVHYYL